MMQIYFAHDMRLLVVNVFFVFLCDIQRFKRIKRNTLEAILLTYIHQSLSFFQEQVTVLGHNITAEGYKIDM